MMQQYMDIKRENQDCILFFRLGDFYEMFLEDAEIASKVLEITLTGRGTTQDRIPMCGVPYHSAQSYIVKLVEQGYKVAICEQVEDPKETKGIVRREVVRIVTPGTIMDNHILKDKQNHYIVSITQGNRGYGLAYADLSTGQFALTQFEEKDGINKVIDEVVRLAPAECLVNEALRGDETCSKLEAFVKGTVTYYHKWAFETEQAVKTLTSHFGTGNLSGFGCDAYPNGVVAAGALLDYLTETQKTGLSHINKLAPYETHQFMVLDMSTRRNLELTKTLREGEKKGSLLWVLDHTVTAMGGRLLKQWLEQPLVEVQAICQRLDAVEELVNDGLTRGRLKGVLQDVYDLERLLGRIALGTANARDLVSLKSSLSELPILHEALEACGTVVLQGIYRDLDLLSDIYTLIDEAIMEEPPFSVREGGLIKATYHEDVQTLRKLTTEGKDWIARLEAEEKQRTGIKSLKVGFNKVFGYFIEVTKSNLNAVPEDYIRKQTLANAERFITSQLKEYESMVLGAEDRITQLEYQIFVEVRNQVNTAGARIQQTAGLLAQLDGLLSLAQAAIGQNYVKPEVNESDLVEITEGRHPVVEKMHRGEWFVPNDTFLDRENHRLMMITGPNMAGKSTYMRQVALITLMAQVGSFVPAERAAIGVVDRIFTRVGASDDLATGQSTFMVEMNEVANILNNATAKSLILLDEIGRGTATFDGLSIAWAVAEYIHDANRIGAKTLFATHYHELTELAEMLPGVNNYTVAIKEQGDNITFLRKIVPGGTDRSYGIQVAKLAGLPQVVITRAKHILQSLEKQELVGQGQRLASIGTEAEQLVQETDDVQQMSLFVHEAHPVVEEIKGIDLLNLTPLEAINLLHKLQKQLRA